MGLFVLVNQVMIVFTDCALVFLMHEGLQRDWRLEVQYSVIFILTFAVEEVVFLLLELLLFFLFLFTSCSSSSRA